VHGGRVGQVELGTVGEHQSERVAAAEAKAVQAGGDAADAVGVPRPRELRLAVLGAQRHLIGALGGGLLESGADGLDGHPGVLPGNDDGPPWGGPSMTYCSGAT
jgi:hypothetical protein